MERGLYAAASAMMAQQAVQESIAQNIANANTTGYKQDNLTFKALHGMMLQRNLNGVGTGPNVGELGMGVTNDQTYTDWQEGMRATTGNPLDLSLDKGQFFAVSTPIGERYTRAGNFKLNGAGQLLTADGKPVLGRNNAPIVLKNSDVQVRSNGDISSGGQIVAQLKIMQSDPDQLQRQQLLRKEGDNLFATTNPGALQAATTPGVHSGTLEQSNVNSVQSLVQMITAERGFDMAQRAITTQDDLLRQANTEIGK